MKKKTNQQFLLLQAIGIILVVIGHKEGISIFFDWFPVYSFHMPLFIFISGYFYKSESDRNLKSFILNKIRKLLIPYFIWNFIYGIIIYILKWKNVIVFGGNLSFRNLFIEPWIGGHQFVFNLAGWFVLSLFIVQVTYVFTRWSYRHIHLENEYIIMCIFLIIGCFSIIKANSGWINGWKLTIVRAIFLLPFYHMGYLYKEKLEERDNLNNWIYLLILFVVQFLLIKKYKVLTFTAVWCNDFNRNNILLPYITSATGIMFWLRISKIMLPSIKNSIIISYIGKNTWTIMMHHLFIFFLINLCIAIISPILGLEGFDYNLFSSDVYYAYTSGVEQFRFFYVIAGIFIPLGIKYYLDKLFLKNEQFNKFSF